MKDFFGSFKEGFSEKINSPLYFVYLSAFVLYNWESFYVLFIENVRGSTANRITVALNYWGSNLDLGIQLLNNFVNHLLLPYGIPMIFTYLIIVQVPKIHLRAHRIYLNHLRDRKIQFYEHMRDIDRDRARLLKESVEAKESQADSAEKIIERDKQLNDLLAQVASLQEQLDGKPENTPTNDQSGLWHREIDKMTSGPSRDKVLNHMDKLYDLIYKKSGEVYDGIGNLKNIDMNTFAFADLHNLIMIKNGYAELTNKGKVFMKFYLNKRDEFSVN